MRLLEDAQTGERLGPYRYVLTKEMALFVASNVGQESLETNHAGGVIAPNCVTDNDYAVLLHEVFTSKEAVHTKAEHYYINPPVVGKEMIVSGQIIDRYSRRGREYLMFATEIKDEDGTEIVRSNNVLLINL